MNGGLLVGHVYDTNTGAALNSAAVASDDLPAETADSFATPDDPGQDDGLYVLFSSLIGGHPFTASKASYGDDTHSATIVADSVTGRDFDLPAGRIGAGPSLIALRLDAGQTITATLFVTNTGTLSADFTVNEVDAPLQYPSPTGPFAQATRHTGMKRLADLDAQAVFVYDPPAVPALPAGQVLRSWASGLAHPWGIGYDARSEELWIGDTAAGGGDDRLHAFAPDGTARGAVVETAFIGAIYSAGLVFDPFSGKFWQAPVGGDPCLFEVDPVSQVVTPQRICPPFDYAQRGLAFDPLTRTFYSGAWTSGILYHFDRQGTILDSANLDLNISGLAFNPATRHLFVLSNAAAGLDVYVLDVEDHYAILGGFDIPGLGDYQQAGMSIDCSGHLWAVNQVTGEIFEADSGESGACAYADVPWLSVDPVQGSLLPGASAALELTFNADAAPDPRNWASLVITSDTPYGDLAIDVRLDVGNIYFFPVILK